MKFPGVDVLLMKCLLTEPARAELAETFALHDARRVPELEPYLAPIAGRVRAIVTGNYGKVPAELMERLPKLEIVVARTAGVDMIDLAAARSRGITVTNTSTAQADDVADMAIALLLGCARKIGAGDRFIRERIWQQGKTPPSSTRLAGRTIGIIGLGPVGRGIAQRAAAMRMTVLYAKRLKLDDVPYEYVENVRELAHRADVLVAACAGGAETRRLVNGEVLSALGPNGFLINISRGSVVDTAALIEALQSGTIAGAGLDVFENEPNVPEELLALDNALLSPHSASRTDETQTVIDRLVVDNLIAHFSGNKPASVVA